MEENIDGDPKFYLCISQVDDSGKRGNPFNKPIPFTPSGVHIFGRAICECDLVIRDLEISAQHMLLVIDAKGISIRDMNSTNGTKLNGVKIQSGPAPADQPFVQVQVGDVIRIGCTELVVCKEKIICMEQDEEGDMVFIS